MNILSQVQNTARRRECRKKEMSVYNFRISGDGEGMKTWTMLALPKRRFPKVKYLAPNLQV